jgi:hypothetical protein
MKTELMNLFLFIGICLVVYFLFRNFNYNNQYSLIEGMTDASTTGATPTAVAPTNNGIAGSTTNQNVASYSTNAFINQAHFGSTTLTNRFNGVDNSMTINDSGQNSSPSNFILMNYSNPFGTFTSNMGMFECIFYLNDKTTSKNGIESDINTYYSIY